MPWDILLLHGVSDRVGPVVTDCQGDRRLTSLILQERLRPWSVASGVASGLAGAPLTARRDASAARCPVQAESAFAQRGEREPELRGRFQPSAQVAGMDIHLVDEIRDPDDVVLLHRGRVLAHGSAGTLRQGRSLADVLVTMAPLGVFPNRLNRKSPNRAPPFPFATVLPAPPSR